MKDHSSQSKEVLVFLDEKEAVHKQNGINQMSRLCDKFSTIFKLFMYLLLTFFFLWIGYVLLSEYIPTERPIRVCGVTSDIYDEEMTDQSTEGLEAMASKEEKEIMNFFQILKDSIADVNESENILTTVLPFAQDTVDEAVTKMRISTTKSVVYDESSEATVDNMTDDWNVSSSIIDSKFKNKNDISTPESNEEVTYFDISNDSSDPKIIGSEPEEYPSEETNEKLYTAEWNLFSTFSPPSVQTNNEMDESNLETTTHSLYDRGSTLSNLNDDIFGADYTDRKDAELLYNTPKAQNGKNCKIPKDAVLQYIKAGITNWDCEDDEDESTESESKLDLKQSSTTEYSYLDYFDYSKDTLDYTSMNDDYLGRNYPILYDELDNGTKVHEEEIEEEIQENNMEEGKNNYLPDWLVPIVPIGNVTDLPSSIEIESSINYDEIVTNEDEELDKMWDELSPKLDSLEDSILPIKALPEEMEAFYVKLLCTFLDATLENMLSNPLFNITEEERLALNSERMIMQHIGGFQKNISDITSFSDLDRYMKTKMDGLNQDGWAKNYKVKRSVDYTSINDEDSINSLIDEKNSAQILRHTINMEKMMLVQKMEQFDESEYQFVESNLEKFFNRMELLSQHIDRLHERYLEMNELNDDYVSKEFPIESS